MKRSEFFLVAFLLMSVGALSNRGGAQNSTPSTPAQADPLKKPVSLRLNNASLADVVKAMGEDYGVNILADSYSREAGFRQTWDIKDVPLNEFIDKLAEVHRREVRRINNIIVLRHLRSGYEAAREGAPNTRLIWRSPGEVMITLTSGVPAGTLRETTQTIATRPANVISLRVRDAALKDVASQLQKQAGWQISIEPVLAIRRINASLHAITLGQLSDALIVLVNGSRSVHITQTPVQKAQDEAGTEAFRNRQDARHRASDALKQKLVELLNDAQIAKLESGETVEISIASLPPNLQKEAVEYVRITWEQVQKGQTPYTVNPADFGRFTLEFWPDPRNPITVNGIATNGKSVAF